MSGYIFEFQSAPGGPAQYSPDGKVDPPVDVAAHNAALQAAELAHWAEKPARQLGYFHFPTEEARTTPRVWRSGFLPNLTGAYVSIWPGDRIGTILEARVYTGNFGGRMVSLRVRGTNGAEYYGRASWDNGSCVWLRRAK